MHDRGDQPFADLAAGIHAVVCAACAAKDQRIAALEAQRDELAAALRFCVAYLKNPSGAEGAVFLSCIKEADSALRSKADDDG